MKPCDQYIILKIFSAQGYKIHFTDCLSLIRNSTWWWWF